jgi:hypothetical protein
MLPTQGFPPRRHRARYFALGADDVDHNSQTFSHPDATAQTECHVDMELSNFSRRRHLMESVESHPGLSTGHAVRLVPQKPMLSVSNQVIGSSASILAESTTSLSGWRKGVLCCMVAGSLVLGADLAVLIWATRQERSTASTSVLYDGSCSQAKKYSTCAHLVINALSTILLAAGNYCMQLLSSPSRQEIDWHHARKRVLDIGLNSWSNVFKVAWPKGIAWCILAMTSIPLHLLYARILY